MRKIKVAAVSYLNTKPLLFGIQQPPLIEEIELSLEFPSVIAKKLQENNIDLGLVPVAAIPNIPNARIISDYGIAANGKVASVSLFSNCPLDEIQTVYLDFQSRTSIRLAQILLKHYWKIKPTYLPASENYIEQIKGTAAGVIIGDRALTQNKNFPFVYDLAEYWHKLTGLPFVFAAWVANKELPAVFLQEFEKANALGLQHLDEIIAKNHHPDYDLNNYYKRDIQYLFTQEHLKGLNLFLNYLKEEPVSGKILTNSISS